jgi:ABC-type long-subunit fatty acid transport system fused permease/ATPase subunit
MLVGHKLVQLEVNNQRVEGRFRTGLVVLEQTPEELAKPSARGVAEPATRIATETPLLWFTSTIDALTHNYRRLYANFALFDTWISGYDQIMILLPYFLVAPMLFAERDSDRVTLGVLIRVTNAFKEVFGAMSILTENWDMVNDFRSTVRRLSEFEAHVYQQLHTFKRHRLVDDEHAAASGVQIAVAVAPPAAASTACVSAHTLASAPPL